MLDFTLRVPTRIHFGKTSMDFIPDEITGMGARKLLLVTGMGSVKKNGIFDAVVAQVQKTGAEYVELSGIKPNPRTESVHEGIELCRKNGTELILAVGGGSVIDAAKAIAAGVCYEGDVWDFFISDKPLEAALPVATVLTLAATGSEMNQNAVITNEEQGRKLAVSSDLLIPVFSVLDPRNTFTVNQYHTAAGIADIMAHVFEYYLTSIAGCALQDSIEEAILTTCVNMAPLVAADPFNYDARANIMWASTLALNGIAGKGKSSDFTLHMIEHEVSAITDLSHGAGLAILIPAFMKVMAGKFGDETLCRYAVNVLGLQGAAANRELSEKAAACTRAFFDSMGLPSRLAETGITRKDIDRIVDGAITARRDAPELDQLDEKGIRQVLELSF